MSRRVTKTASAVYSPFGNFPFPAGRCDLTCACIAYESPQHIINNPLPMKLKRHIIPLTALLLFVSCDLLSDPGLDTEYPGDENVAWVEQIFSGGQQCVKNDGYTPPDTKKLLRFRGIAVFDTGEEHLLTCAACSCPSYAAIHYALIHIDNVEKAEEIGFELSDGPY